MQRHANLQYGSILLHGDIDAIVPPDQAQLAGATTAVVEGAGHFDWVHPGTAAYQRLLSTLEDLFEK
jgi:pimeloyl-ACP methyl ester carboxylesterase